MYSTIYIYNQPANGLNGLTTKSSQRDCHRPRCVASQCLLTITQSWVMILGSYLLHLDIYYDVIKHRVSGCSIGLLQKYQVRLKSVMEDVVVYKVHTISASICKTKLARLLPPLPANKTNPNGKIVPNLICNTQMARKPACKTEMTRLITPYISKTQAPRLSPLPLSPLP